MFASCSKSEIVDSKFGNDEIGFQTYVGRDAQTKATPIEAVDALKDANYGGIGVYGFYTGKDDYKASSTANLWANERLYWGTITNADGATSSGWTYASTKYWANDDDNYTFLAYAPYGHSTITEVSTGTQVANPSIVYTVPELLPAQQDILYAKAQGTAANFKSGVTLNMKHALSRLTVTAAAPVDQNGFQFDIKKVTISGKFNVSGELTLADAKADATADAGWDATSGEVVYTFYDDDAASFDGEKWDVLPAGTTEAPAVNYAVRNGNADNYLMMIPTTFTETDKATLTVTYTTIYEKQESKPVTKEIPFVVDFKMGKAYSINLVFSHTAEPITFNVTVDTWDEEGPVTSSNTTNGNNPEKYPATEE